MKFRYAANNLVAWLCPVNFGIYWASRILSGNPIPISPLFREFCLAKEKTNEAQIKSVSHSHRWTLAGTWETSAQHLQLFLANKPPPGSGGEDSAVAETRAGLNSLLHLMNFVLYPLTECFFFFFFPTVGCSMSAEICSKYCTTPLKREEKHYHLRLQLANYSLQSPAIK